ncbi:MAG: hypothetical protein RLZZ330_201 [Actinomycetota bacterium]|jgi:hypothetical protein
MKFGYLPEDLNEEIFLKSIAKLADEDEEILYAFVGKSGASARYLVVTNRKLLLVKPSTMEIKKQVLIEEVHSARFSLGSWEVKFGNSSTLLFAFDKKDKDLIQVAQTQLNIPNSKSLKDNLKERIDLSLRKFPERAFSQEFIEIYGNCTAKGFLDWKTVEIFSNGFVSVEGAPPEKLLQISSSIQVTKKSGLGKVVGTTTAGLVSGTLSGGMFVAGSRGNRRGDVYLTIVTDKKTYSLHEQLHSQSASIKEYESEQTVLALEAAGLAALEASSKDQRAASEPVAIKSLGEKLRELAELHESGVLTDQEFERAKHKLLSD